MQTALVPVSLGFLGTANLLTLRGVGPVDDSGRPNYLWELQDVQELTPAIPAVPAIPATDNTPEMPEGPALAATYSTTTLTAGNKEMTAAQWNSWGKTPTDEEYQLTCLAKNLGLTRA